MKRYLSIKTALLLTGLFAFFQVNSQNYHFMDYDAKDGLCDNFIYNIIQDNNGYLWLGTGEGICRFDGSVFQTVFPGDSLPDVPVKASFKDSRGRIWFGFDNGTIAVLENNRFSLLDQSLEKLNVITGFDESREGMIIVGTQNQGILIIYPDKSSKLLTKGLEGLVITRVKLLNNSDLLIGTFDGLFLYNINIEHNSLDLAGRFEDIPYTHIQGIFKNEDDLVYVATADEGLFRIKMSKVSSRQIFEVEKIGQEFDLGYANVHSVYKDKKQNLWVGTWGTGLVKLNYSTLEDSYLSSSEFGEAHGINASYIQAIYKDIEGNLWIGTYGEGLFVLKSQAFTFYSSALKDFNNDIKAVLQTGNKYLLGAENSILITDLTGENERIIGIKNGLPPDQVTSLYEDSNRTIWIGTSRSGIYRMSPDMKSVTRYYFSENSLENMINRITGREDELWVATNGGVLFFDFITGKQILYTTRNKLPHNKINDIYIDNNQEVWIATPGNGIYCLTLSESLRIDAPAEFEFLCLAQDDEKNIWAATEGDGVFQFAPDSLMYFSATDGLKNNYCYSILEDLNGNVWIGHRLGMSKISSDKKNIKTYTVEQGITADCNVHALIKNAEGQLLFGTNEGLIIYNPLDDKQDTIPPFLNITSLTISDESYDFTKPVSLPYDKYKIRIDFRGINLKNPENVLYQYKLDGYDDWSEPTSIPYVIYGRVEDGDYTFMLRACDENGVCTQYPLTLQISVKIPLWKAWWFIVLMVAVVFLMVYLYVAYREKKQKQIQEYLQTELDARTKEVRAQAREIEEKNRDITDSINYAQRIQASILPPVKKLNKVFSGSFVFYQPRDIVSGDFYWYDKVWNDKFIIVCADSTGHGVPGAFMSMIGTTLIKDICSRTEVNSPSRILLTLDEEVQAALNQNLEAEKSNDGMDIIVAEIDLNSLELKIASAMRPVILYVNGEQTYVKGSRSSVGGRFDEQVQDKVFHEEHFQLQKGDLLYMFSDGYPDQFGGPLGKKFKMVRLKNLLHDIHTKPMDEQFNYIKSNFMLWKEELEQVDDVLFMGIKM